MKEVVLILSKTKMNNHQVCVGGITNKGRYVRLLDKNGNNQDSDTDLNLKQIWEVEFTERPNKKPPHIEDILVQNRIRKDDLKDNTTLKEVIEKMNIPIWKGNPENLFDGLLNWIDSGPGYINEENGIPQHSVGFWISDVDLKKVSGSYSTTDNTRYQYVEKTEGLQIQELISPYSNVPYGAKIIKFKGLEEPLETIPAGTLLRVSLARWWNNNHETENRCYLQLSGWYDLEENSGE